MRIKSKYYFYKSEFWEKYVKNIDIAKITKITHFSLGEKIILKTKE